MRTFTLLGFVLCVVAVGCDDTGSSVPVTANPYGDAPTERQGPSPAPPPPASRPNPAAPNRAAPVAVSSQRKAQSAAPKPVSPPPPARRVSVRDDGAQAASLSLPEYSRMSRLAADVLSELTEIHIAVDESGDAGPYQDRWGELTARLTQLHREVLQSGYPPADDVRHLKESWLPRLEETIANAARAIAEHTAVESGFAICHTEAEEIYAHLTRSRDDAPSE
ncbi:MAG: hypothetical protein AB7U20_13750 [Planctomycetaceae bacterium]